MRDYATKNKFTDEQFAFALKQAERGTKVEINQHIYMKQQSKKLKVTHFHRKPYGDYFSIERLFADIRKKLPSDIICKVAVSPFVSRGLFKRIFNIIKASMLQGDINHITGDVHYLAFLLRKKKTILTIHDCTIIERTQGIKKKLYLFFWFWLPEKRSSMITVVSHSTKKELLRYLYCDPGKIRVIHNCISDDFKPYPKLFNMEMPVILQVGTMANKNLLRVAEALKGLPCHLRIIGRLDNQQVLAMTDNRIEYSSIADVTDEEIVKEYQRADMLVFVSTYEGFGMPIVEANAVGRPVITSNILSMPEVADNAACIVDPFNVNEIKNGILRILTDESYRNTLVNNGYMNAQRFQSQNIAKQYTKLYEELNRCKQVEIR
jgi:glycosyltransferase involved in cell wall biosynthesis